MFSSLRPTYENRHDYMTRVGSYFVRFVLPFTTNKTTPAPLLKDKYSGTCSYRVELGWVKRYPVRIHSPTVKRLSTLRQHSRMSAGANISDERKTAVGERWLAACTHFTASSRNRCFRTTAAQKWIDTDEILWESSHPRSNH